MQTIQHVLFFNRQVANHAMQEQSRLVEEPFGRLDALDHYAARQRVQPGIFFRRKIFPRENHDRQIAKLRRVAQTFQDFESGHVWKAKIKNHAIECLLRNRPALLHQSSPK